MTVDPSRVIGVGTDFTARTMMPTDDYFGRGDNEIKHRLHELRRDAVARRHGH